MKYKDISKTDITKIVEKRFWNINLKDFKLELKKCQPLCSDCHILKTTDELGHISAIHGRRTMYRRGCRCDKCKEAQRIGSKNYRIWKKTGIKRP